MRCGNCKAQSAHITVTEIKDCYAGVENPHTVAYVNDARSAVSAERSDEPVVPASEAQMGYIMSLQRGKQLPEDWDWIDGTVNLDKGDASDHIKTLKAFPWKEAKGKGNVEYNMPAGKYALQDDDNTWRFYQVDKPTEGRWKGYTFIKLLVGSPGNYRQVDIGAVRRHEILEIIDANAKQAMVDYGLQSGHCGRCSSPLTDPESLARGLGPICAGKEW